MCFQVGGVMQIQTEDQNNKLIMSTIESKFN
jgi:hypothetical protein